MEFKLTAAGNVIEQLHNRERSILVSMYQTTKYLIFPCKNSKQTKQVALLDALIRIAIQGYQLAITAHNSIIDYTIHHDFSQTYPTKVLNTDALYPSKIWPLSKEAANQNSSICKESLFRLNLRFSALSDFYNNFLFTPVWKITSINYVRYDIHYRFKCRGYDR